jgi:hypothetical protein
MEDGPPFIAKDRCQGNTDHEGLDASSRPDMYPDARSPSLGVGVLEKMTDDASHHRRRMAKRLVRVRIGDWQNLGVAFELNTHWWSRYEWS